MIRQRVGRREDSGGDGEEGGTFRNMEARILGGRYVHSAWALFTS
jgi:hypothetical protein